MLYRNMGLTVRNSGLWKTGLPNYGNRPFLCCGRSTAATKTKPVLKSSPPKGRVQVPGRCRGGYRSGKRWCSKSRATTILRLLNPTTAATGVGILRDVFSMGARPIAVPTPLWGAEDERTKYLREAVAGMAGYGSVVEVPTVGGIQFDPCYAGSPLLNAMAVGTWNTASAERSGCRCGQCRDYAGAPTAGNHRPPSPRKSSTAQKRRWPCRWAAQSANASWKPAWLGRIRAACGYAGWCGGFDSSPRDGQ